MSMESGSHGSDFANGLGVLIIAQFLSAYMGAYHEDTYATFGSNWKESVFYTHAMCMPFFLPLSSILQDQYVRLARTPPLATEEIFRLSNYLGSPSVTNKSIALLQAAIEGVPRGIFFLTINIFTQIVCISGVNLLCAKSSAVTVTIVLNIRKLVSFIFSTILFGHQLGGMMVFGSVLVFGSGALYGWETSKPTGNPCWSSLLTFLILCKGWRLPQQREVQSETNGHLQKERE